MKIIKTAVLLGLLCTSFILSPTPVCAQSVSTNPGEYQAITKNDSIVCTLQTLSEQQCCEVIGNLDECATVGLNLTAVKIRIENNSPDKAILLDRDHYLKLTNIGNCFVPKNSIVQLHQNAAWQHKKDVFISGIRGGFLALGSFLAGVAALAGIPDPADGPVNTIAKYLFQGLAGVCTLGLMGFAGYDLANSRSSYEVMKQTEQRAEELAAYTTVCKKAVQPVVEPIVEPIVVEKETPTVEAVIVEEADGFGEPHGFEDLEDFEPFDGFEPFPLEPAPVTIEEAEPAPAVPIKTICSPAAKHYKIEPGHVFEDILILPILLNASATPNTPEAIFAMFTPRLSYAVIEKVQ